MNDFPNFDFKISGAATAQFLSSGLSDFHAAVQYIWRLPYGRNSNRADFNLVLKEKRGTCSTKHALLAQAAFEQKKPIYLMLGIFEMNTQNTAGIKAVFDEFGLQSLPEAHCYLRFQENRTDVTRFPNENEEAEKPIEKFLYEEQILPEQIGDYKLALHRRFFQNWMREKRLDEKFEFEELWNIREQCIIALAEKRGN